MEPLIHSTNHLNLDIKQKGENNSINSRYSYNESEKGEKNPINLPNSPRHGESIIIISAIIF